MTEQALAELVAEKATRHPHVISHNTLVVYTGPSVQSIEKIRAITQAMLTRATAEHWDIGHSEVEIWARRIENELDKR